MNCEHWEEIVGIYYQCPCCQRMTDIFPVIGSGFFKEETYCCAKCEGMVMYRHKLLKSDCKMRITMKIDNTWTEIKKNYMDKMVIKI
jgi:hypothetical protein